MADPKVKFKRSSVANKRPSLSNLETGEIALNTYDGKLFTVQDTGGIGIGTTVTLVNPWQESYGGGTITYSGVVTATSFHGDGSGLTNLNITDFQRTTTSQTATADQTDFSVSYTVGNIDVYLNGAKLESSEFTATNGTSVVLATGATVNDVLEFIVYSGGLIGPDSNVNTTGVITATSFHGDGSNLTGIQAGYFEQNQTGIHTIGNVGIGTTTATGAADTNNTYVLNAGIVTANYYYGDGSNLTGINASGIGTDGSVNTTGIITATSFHGDGSNLTGIGGTVAISTTAPSSPSAGDLWYDSDEGRTYIYYTDDGSSQWVDANPGTSSIATGQRTTTSQTATAGQTTFTVSYSVGAIDVYLNGVKLEGSEFTATNGTSVVLTTAAIADDVLEFVVYEFTGLATTDYNNLVNTPTLITNNNQLTNGAGYIAPDDDVTGGLSFTGTIGIGTTTTQGTEKLRVEGDARVTGILTVGTASLTLNGTTGSITGGSLTNAQVAAISTEIVGTGTTVDVFVYDTSKDSDGGAWRKRTQHTSWYNETLGTATRGTRKDFPAVAIIVAEADQVTIYDGDDPDLPMWMVFTGTFANYSTEMLWSETGYTTIHALNGQLWNGRCYVSFIPDIGGYYYTSDRSVYQLGIANRNGGNSIVQYTSPVIVNRYVNDVAMTVLPNAPIDDTTGLPVPTIAVATNGGVTTIKDDGTTASTQRGTNEVHSITFDEDHSEIFSWGTEDDYPRHITRLPIGSWINSSTSSTLWTNNYFSSFSEGAGAAAASTGTAAGGVVTVANSGRHFGIEYGSGGNPDDRLVIFHPLNATNNANQNLSAFVTSSYNTGWMHGDIKGAFLSDTSTDDVTASSNLIDNGDFGTGDFTNWSTSGTTAPSISSGGALLTTGAVDGSVWQSTSGEATSGKWVITWTVTSNSGGYFGLYLNNSSSNATDGTLVQDAITTSGSYYYEGSITSVEFRHRLSSSGIIDDITLSRVVEEDRSVNNKGLQVFGTVTKSAVATGADLVAYSGFSASNYLEQPYNSDLDFGTGDYYMSVWAYGGGDSQCLIIREHSTDSEGSYLIFQNNGVYLFYSRGNGDVTWSSFSSSYGYGSYWSHVMLVRTGGILYGYVNGEPAGSTPFSGNVTNTDALLSIGKRYGGSQPQIFTGSLALAKVGATAPSPEQIKKIYEDEKVLFQENAKCTLYGSSDAVTALGYDDDEETLYVGTSSGRSDFRGLRRINNTTTAVTTAISASNGLVVEE